MSRLLVPAYGAQVNGGLDANKPALLLSGNQAIYTSIGLPNNHGTHKTEIDIGNNLCKRERDDKISFYSYMRKKGASPKTTDLRKDENERGNSTATQNSSSHCLHPCLECKDSTETRKRSRQRERGNRKG